MFPQTQKGPDEMLAHLVGYITVQIIYVHTV